MLISHHPPCQYDRTFCLFKNRFCTRCTGILIGTIVSIILAWIISFGFLLTLILSILLPLPAILNFTLNELCVTKNNNYKRITSGILLGISIGFALKNICSGKLIFGISILLWIFLLEIIVAIIMHRANILEKFIKQYEDEIYIINDNKHIHE